MTIDYDKLREDLKQDSYAAAFIGGFGGALMESIDIDDAEPDELIRIAKDRGVDFSDYLDE